jgi:tryptophan 2,3-dioxygenase
MKILDPGHRYELTAGDTLHFLQKEGTKVVRDGTTNEELLQVLIHRVTEAYQQLPCKESIRALHDLRHALVTFRLRTARRVAAKVEGTHQPHDHVSHSA